MSSKTLTQQHINDFKHNGYVIIKKWQTGDSLAALQSIAHKQLKNPTEPLELEAKLGYPGAPDTIDTPGGLTPRRLLGAYGREPLWQNFPTSAELKRCLQQLLPQQELMLSQAHHNCLMTKSPHFSSDTGWHQDSRYWHFAKNELVTAWLALGQEQAINGGLQVIPGSHCMPLKQTQFDEDAFFSADHPENASLIKQYRNVALEAGDLLLFHCQLLHRASRNLTDTAKLSLVFTYHTSDNEPRPNTRSSSQDSVRL